MLFSNFVLGPGKNIPYKSTNTLNLDSYQKPTNKGHTGYSEIRIGPWGEPLQRGQPWDTEPLQVYEIGQPLGQPRTETRSPADSLSTDIECLESNLRNPTDIEEAPNAAENNQNKDDLNKEEFGQSYHVMTRRKRKKTLLCPIGKYKHK